MGDFQQNTITNRQAVLDYIDANSGGGSNQNLEQVLTQGNSTGNISIISPVDVNDNSRIDCLTNQLLLNRDTLVGLDSINVSLQMNSTAQVTATNVTSGFGGQLIVQPENIYANTADNLGVNCELNMTSNGTPMSIIRCVNGYTNSKVELTSGYAILEWIENDPSASASYDNYISIDVNGVSIKYTEASIVDSWNVGFEASQVHAKMNFNTGSGIDNHIKFDSIGYFINNLPPYDDDTSAGLNGLTTGYLYQTTGLGAITTPGVVMVKQ